MIPIIIGVSFLIFVMIDIIPGDPGSILLGDRGGTQQEIDLLNDQLGYNRPLLVRFASYMYDMVFRFDLGTSYSSNAPVGTEIASRLPITITLAFLSIIFSLVIGLPLGILSAVKQNTLLDRIPTGSALVLASVPTFVLGVILMLIFTFWLRLLPANGISDWRSYIMPMITIGLPQAGYQLRFCRSSMLETLRQDYIRTARAKGATQNMVIWKHALRNALLLIITQAGNSFALLLGGSVATEALFGIQGMGSYIIAGIKKQDLPVVTGGVVVFAILFALVILLVDLSYAFVDPRIRAKYSGRGN